MAVLAPQLPHGPAFADAPTVAGARAPGREQEAWTRLLQLVGLSWVDQRRAHNSASVALDMTGRTVRPGTTLARLQERYASSPGRVPISPP